MHRQNEKSFFSTDPCVTQAIHKLEQHCDPSFKKAFSAHNLSDQFFACYAIARHEVKRCFRIWIQAFVSPTVTRLLFFVIFRLVHLTAVQQVAFNSALSDASFYEKFLIPGLIFSAIMQESCGNTVSSLFPAKYHGVLEASLVAPVSFPAIVLGYVAGGCVRGCLVGALLSLGLQILGFFCLPLHGVQTVLLCLQFSIVGSLMGIAIALLVRSFDQISLINQAILTTLFYFSGTIFQLERCPPLFVKLASFNPFFYFNKGLYCAWYGQGHPLFLNLATWFGLAAMGCLLWLNAFLLKKEYGTRR